MRRILLTAIFIALAATATPAIGDGGDTTDSTGKLLLLLDASGSMKESAGGQTKIAAAKAALKEVVKQLPEDAQVGVRVFGAKVFSAKDKGACTDTQNVVPVGPLDRDGIGKAVDVYKPYGETPIGNALKGAAKDLGSDGKRTIVLLSDGEPTCAPDPCKVAKDLRGTGVDLTVNVVGLNVTGKARDALKCIADAGGGTYYGVDQPDDLASSLVTVSVRSLRHFRLSGTPVTGGTSTADPLPLKPGRYTDNAQGEGNNRYYLVSKPAGGSVSVSVVTRPPYDAVSSNKLDVELLASDGTRCDADYYIRPNILQLRAVMSAAAVFSPQLIGTHETCDAAKTLLARVSVKGPTPTPYELLVGTRAKITNYQGLPARADRPEIYAAAKRVFPELTGPVTPAVGGTSFTDAPVLKPGRYRDSLRSGEQLIYRVPAVYGQSVRVRAALESDAQADRELGRTGVLTDVTMFGPDLRNLGHTGANGSNFYQGSRPLILTAEPGPVRAKNIEAPDSAIRSLSVDGYQYLSIAMAGTLGDDGTNFAAPLTISVVVDGDKSGVPEFAGRPRGPGTKVSSSSHLSGGLPWLPIGIGVGVVALLGAGYALGRRRSASE